MKHGTKKRVDFAMISRGITFRDGSLRVGKRAGVVGGFKKPSLSTIKIATSISGEEKRFKTILEKKADYKKPIYMV